MYIKHHDINVSLIIATINKPNINIKSFNKGCKNNNWNFIVVGDKKHPRILVFNMEIILTHQNKKLNFQFAKIRLYNNYLFKKINISHKVKSIESNSWVNVYDIFLKNKIKIWPRGLPLDEINKKN